MKICRIIAVFMLCIIICMAFLSCTKKTEPNYRHAFIFDTIVTITIYDDTDFDDVLDDAIALCYEYDELFNKNNKNSDVYKLNHANGEAVTVSDSVKKVIEKTLGYSELTNGLYDITISRAVDLWDFKAETPRLPHPYKLEQAVEYIGYKNIVLKGNTIKLLNDANIDLGSAAKGYIADMLVETLKTNGVKHAIINLGGNIVTMDGKDENTPFNVGIQKPFGESGETFGSVKTFDKSVVSSGVYERYFELDGELYHHILDAQTGYPINNGVYSVTILSDSSLDGDILSTVCFILGVEKGIELISSIPNTECIYYLSDGTVQTSGELVQEGEEFIIR